MELSVGLMRLLDVFLVYRAGMPLRSFLCCFARFVRCVYTDLAENVALCDARKIELDEITTTDSMVRLLVWYSP